MIDKDDLVPITPQVIEEHVVDQRAHVEVLRLADAALKEAEDAIKVGRDRLQNAIRRYEERASGPKRGA